jgi:glycosyltransferase involved in cell wall biosynthesis
LAAALTSLLNNPPRRHALAAAARKLLPSYALDTMVDNIASVYRAVWNAKRD